MTIDEIRAGIITALNSHSYEKLLNLLGDTHPGHYGVEDVEFDAAVSDLWVDVPQKTFLYKDARISFSARLGSSREEDGVDGNFSVKISGEGRFEFGVSSTIEVLEISTDGQIDLHDPDEE